MSSRHKIVLVDDNLATLEQGKRLLQEFYKVYTVQQASTLFENLEHDIPDLILLDVEMPEMDGFETIAKLKGDDRYKSIPVIFLTSKSDEESERKGFSLGAVDYITKPFSGPLLHKRISNQILYMRVKDAVEDYSSELVKMVDEVKKTNNELEQAMNQIVEDEQRMRLMLDSMPFACELMGENYRFIDCNEEALKIAGTTIKEEYSEKLGNLIPEYQPCGSLSLELRLLHLNNAIKNGYERFEWSYQNPENGEYIPFEITMVRIMLKGEAVIAAYARDLREQKAIAEEIRRADIAEERSKAKSEFLATMSHEIRTPMNSIIGFSELALDMPDERIAPEGKIYVRKIKDSAVWLLQIINDILDISKIESGKIELENEPFDLNEVLMRCQSVILPDIKEKGLEFEVNADLLAEKKLIGDPIRLYQVLINILYNAVKFTDKGSIVFSAENRNAADEITSFYFEIKDSGIGMDRKQLADIFEPFTQADTSTTRKYGGTGLGLTIARDIVELMGGTLTVDSSPGKGSIFAFEIKFETIEKSADDLDGSQSRFLEKPHFDAEILVCDDNPINQELIREHLARVGIETITVDNGQIGVDIVKNRLEKGIKMFDLIFMDIFMPVMDGIEATNKIKALDEDIPIIALTANVMASDLESYKRNGMPDCLAKPFTTTDLWNTLLKYLKPVSTSAITEDTHVTNEDTLQQKLRLTFIQNNQDKFKELTEAINSGDNKLAHRIVHTLKGNAGQLKNKALKKAAEDVEEYLKAQGTAVPKEKITLLKNEFDLLINELKPLLNNVAIHEITEPLSLEATKELFGKLKILLKDGNTECLKLLDEIRNVPGAGEVIRHMENYDFSNAEDSLKELARKFK